MLPYLGYTTNSFWCVADPAPTPTGDRLSYGANGYSGNTPFKYSGTTPAKLRDFDSNMGDIILVADLNSADANTKPTISTQHSTIIKDSSGSYPNLHRRGMSGNNLMASYAVRNYNKTDGDVTRKTSDQGNLWCFYSPP